MGVLKRLWKRHLRGRPDGYQAYVSLPKTEDSPSIGGIHDCIEDLEYVFEGRLDVYARVRGIAVATDPVPADQFDGDAFDAAIDRLEECYAETHSLTRLEKWRPGDEGLVKSYVVVPVKPLFPRKRTDVSEEPQVRSPAE